MDSTIFYFLAAVCITARAAPSGQQRMYEQHPSPAQLNQQLSYYLENQDNFYSPAEQRQRDTHDQSAPARLETLEPDSEVELVPGVAPPQQPPQQNPVAPNIPGLLPGQRVYIVHMPIPGYRPGTIGGYQPVYIVAAGAQGNAGFPGNGYQNAILVDPSGQPMSPFLGFQKGAVITPQQHPGLILGGPLAYSRPMDLVYQDLASPAGPVLQGAIHLAQQVGLQAIPQGHAAPITSNQAKPNRASASQNEALIAKDAQQNIEATATDSIVAQKPKLRTGAIPRKL